MSEPDGRTPGDLTRTGMALKHDREWDYELDRIKEAVEAHDATFVGLQFPEGLKRRSTAVAADLEQLFDDDITIAISGEPCYGACDLDLDLLRRSDVFVHFGHSPMKESDKIVYIPLFSNVEIEPIIESAIEELSGPDVALVTTAQHMNRFEEMVDQLEDAGFRVHTRRGDERLTHTGQVLGCNYESADVPAPEVLYVGGGKFHPLGLAMDHPEKEVIIADPVNNLVEVADPEPFLRQRYATVHAAMDAESWGVILCTKIGQRRWDIANEIVKRNENAHLITLNEITPDRMQHFNVDAFVNTGCPRITTDDGPRFPKPLLTPGEYEIAIGNRDLAELQFDTFHGTW